MSVQRAELMRSALIALVYFLVSAVTVKLTRFDGGVSFIWVSNAVLLAELSTRRCGVGLFCYPFAVLASLSRPLSSDWAYASVESRLPPGVMDRS